MRKHIHHHIKRLKEKKHTVEIILVIFSLVFSTWLMFHTFGYKDGSMTIAGKAWSDFANHIPLIRSFSFGWNFPVQEPLFAGEPIHYHFIFYLLAGILERIGFRIDWALNIPSIFGFTTLLVIIYFFAKKIFNSKAVGILSVLFFLFNGSLSFIDFFIKHPLGFNTLTDIVTNKTFPSFGPYDKGIVSAFWNLNIYTNQRHLAPAYALTLFIIGAFLWYALRNKNPHYKFIIIIGTIFGLSFFFHMAAFMITGVVLAGFFLVYKELRKPILFTFMVAALFAIPEYLYLKTGSPGGGFAINFVPGYLIHNNLTLINFLHYWFANLGFHSALMFVGVYKAPMRIRKIFFAVFPVFIIGNLLQFSPEMAANHKFFNFFMLIASMFSAYAIVLLWKKKKMLAKPVICLVTFLLMFSGIIDFFPIANDDYITLADYPINKDIQWIRENTPLHANFFNTNYLYDTANLAGRNIFLGWPYFPWSAGYNTTERSQQIKDVLSSQDKTTVCNFMQTHQLDYISLTNPSEDFPFSFVFFKENFREAYKSNTATIYSVAENCQ